MLSQEIQKLGLKLIMLGTLLACLVVMSGESKGHVLSCCTTCNTNYSSCLQGCGSDPACQEVCGDKFDTCEDRCWRVFHQLC
jgi:hypothetical protein